MRTGKCRIQALLAVHGDFDLETSAAEAPGQEIPDFFVVFDEKNFQLRPRLASDAPPSRTEASSFGSDCSGVGISAGNRSVNALPQPT